MYSTSSNPQNDPNTPIEEARKQRGNRDELFSSAGPFSSQARGSVDRRERRRIYPEMPSAPRVPTPINTPPHPTIPSTALIPCSPLSGSPLQPDLGFISSPLTEKVVERLPRTCPADTILRPDILPFEESLTLLLPKFVVPLFCVLFSYSMGVEMVSVTGCGELFLLVFWLVSAVLI
ncbi:hypothetical protein BHE74_00026841 [Ensete ventricosum]|nr:hypothetical protein BHE74_00026841 [Ensete ventricosum]